MAAISLAALLWVALGLACDGPGNSPGEGRAEVGAPDVSPNFILLVVDDLGWGDLEVYGHPAVKTPHLDELARQGALFTQFYVNGPVCSPSRVGMLTGRFPARDRIHAHLSASSVKNREKGMPDFLDPEIPNLARFLSQRGYLTAHIGKWHLGQTVGSPSPARYGFHSHKVIHHQLFRRRSRRPSTLKGSRSSEWNLLDLSGNWRARSSAMIVDEVVRFIQEHRSDSFFVQAWFVDPHGPLKATPEDRAVYQEIPNGAMKNYLGVVSRLDREIGRLLEALDALEDLSSRTVVVFTSDNGPEGVIPQDRTYGVGRTGPFRGRKRSLYEGGVRTPFLVRWPNRISAGRVDDTTVISGVDLFPTVATLAGHGDDLELDLDGEDMSEALLSGPVEREKPLFWQWRFANRDEVINRSPMLAVRQGCWKLLMNPDRSRIELYDIVADPRELNNLAGSHPWRVSHLSERLMEWYGQLPEGPLDDSAGSASYPWPGER